MEDRDRLHESLRAAESDPPVLTVVGSVDHRKLRDSKEKRIAAWKEYIKAQTLDVLYDAMDHLSHYFGRIQGTQRLYTNAEAVALMNEILSMRTTSEALEARRQMIREGVFDHIDLILADEGVEDPKNTSGYLAVPETGKKFCKEGAGLGPEVCDWHYLKKQFTREQWAQVVTVKTAEVPDRDKLADFVTENPSMAIVVRQALSPGAPKTPRFQVRDIGEDEEYDDD